MEPAVYSLATEDDFIVHDRIAIRDVFDDVGSKYVPLHVIECSWIGASASRFCVWPSHARH